jgi:hypothetical protein
MIKHGERKVDEMRKYRSTCYHKVLDLAVAGKLHPSRNFTIPEEVIPEPLPEPKPFVRISPNVVKRI